MPTYEFRCPKGHEFERLYRTISGAPSEVPCPECGAIAERQISAGAGFAFKGSGFYLTDYGKNAHRGEKQKEGSSKEGSSKEGSDSKNTGSSKDGSSNTGSSKDGSSKTGSDTKAESPKAASQEPKADKPKAQSPKPKE
jgi:putative FmdB family regulatory protein